LRLKLKTAVDGQKQWPEKRYGKNYKKDQMLQKMHRTGEK
tara:strand:+ start:62 stop:181 length:120 start_codon:yes stop_codon:yes gene_type:complete